jgi:hypothetical protein
LKPLIAALAALAVFAGPAAAHRGHASMSVVVIDAATGAVTVTHRAAAHDVEPALVDLAPDAQPSLDDPDALAALVAHGRNAFILLDEAGRRVPLAHTGTDLAGDDVRLSYSGRLPPAARVVIVDSNLFEVTHLDQENQVNVRRAGVTQTAVFRPGDRPQRIEFEEKPPPR